MTRRMVIEVGDARVTGHVTSRGRILASHTVAVEGDGGIAGAVTRLLSEASFRGKRDPIEVRIEPPLCQRRVVEDLPPVPLHELKVMVAGQSGRFFRQNGHPLVTDATWLPDCDGAPRALLVALDHACAEALVNAVRGGKRSIISIRPAILEGTTLSLLPLSEVARRAGHERRVTSHFVLLALAVWGCLGAWSFGRGLARARQASADLEISRPLLDTLAVVHRVMDSAASMIEAITRAEETRNVVPRQLVALAAALPESTYILSVDLNARDTGRVVARSSRPMAALAAAQRIPGLAVELEQPPTRDGDLDRFSWRVGSARP